MGIIEEVCQKIKTNGLSMTLTDEKINLPGEGYAYRISDDIRKGMKTNQLRKCFEMIKSVESIDDPKEAKKKLTQVLPLVAYSAGRGLCPKIFFDLMNTCITKIESDSKNDINIFVKFMEAIVAYTKYLGEGDNK